MPYLSKFTLSEYILLKHIWPCAIYGEKLIRRLFILILEILDQPMHSFVLCPNKTVPKSQVLFPEKWIFDWLEKDHLRVNFVWASSTIRTVQTSEKVPQNSTYWLKLMVQLATSTNQNTNHSFYRQGINARTYQRDIRKTTSFIGIMSIPFRLLKGNCIIPKNEGYRLADLKPGYVCPPPLYVSAKTIKSRLLISAKV